MMHKLIILKISFIQFGLCYATTNLQNLQRAQMASLNERMTQMINSLYASPYITSLPKMKSTNTTPTSYVSMPYIPSTEYTQTSTSDSTVYSGIPSHYSPTYSSSSPPLTPPLSPPLSPPSSPLSSLSPSPTYMATQSVPILSSSQNSPYPLNYPSHASTLEAGISPQSEYPYHTGANNVPRSILEFPTSYPAPYNSNPIKLSPAPNSSQQPQLSPYSYSEIQKPTAVSKQYDSYCQYHSDPQMPPPYYHGNYAQSQPSSLPSQSNTFAQNYHSSYSYQPCSQSQPSNHPSLSNPHSQSQPSSQPSLSSAYSQIQPSSYPTQSNTYAQSQPSGYPTQPNSYTPNHSSYPSFSNTYYAQSPTQSNNYSQMSNYAHSQPSNYPIQSNNHPSSPPSSYSSSYSPQTVPQSHSAQSFSLKTNIPSASRSPTNPQYHIPPPPTY